MQGGEYNLYPSQFSMLSLVESLSFIFADLSLISIYRLPRGLSVVEDFGAGVLGWLLLLGIEVGGLEEGGVWFGCVEQGVGGIGV